MKRLLSVLVLLCLVAGYFALVLLRDWGQCRKAGNNAAYCVVTIGAVRHPNWVKDQ